MHLTLSSDVCNHFYVNKKTKNELASIKMNSEAGKVKRSNIYIVLIFLNLSLGRKLNSHQNRYRG